jgi:hypothetical protein
MRQPNTRGPSAATQARTRRESTLITFLWALFARVVIVGFLMVGVLAGSYMIQAIQPPANATTMCAEKVMYIDPTPGVRNISDPIYCEVTA